MCMEDALLAMVLVSGAFALSVMVCWLVEMLGAAGSLSRMLGFDDDVSMFRDDSIKKTSR